MNKNMGLMWMNQQVNQAIPGPLRLTHNGGVQAQKISEARLYHENPNID